MSTEAGNLRKRGMEEDAALEEHWKRSCEMRAKFVEDLVKKMDDDLRKNMEEEDRKKEQECQKKQSEEIDKMAKEVRKEEDEEFLKRLFMSDRERELNKMVRQWILEGRMQLSLKFCHLIQEVLKCDDAVKCGALAKSKSSAGLLNNQNLTNIISESKDCQCSATDASHRVGNMQVCHDDDNAHERALQVNFVDVLCGLLRSYGVHPVELSGHQLEQHKKTIENMPHDMLPLFFHILGVQNSLKQC